jgi:hypothetical protein
MPVTMKRLVEFMLDEKKRSHENNRGNMIYRWFGDDVRYTVDFADDFKSEGWEQFDTDQDAAYFGVWVNKVKFYTLTYAEGDWTLVTCPDAGHYNAEVEDAIRFYGEGFVAKTIDADGSMTIFRQEREKFLIQEAR